MGELSFIADVDSRGRITVPRTIRALLELKDGDFIKVGNVQKVTKEASDV